MGLRESSREIMYANGICVICFFSDYQSRRFTVCTHIISSRSQILTNASALPTARYRPFLSTSMQKQCRVCAETFRQSKKKQEPSHIHYDCTAAIASSYRFEEFEAIAFEIHHLYCAAPSTLTGGQEKVIPRHVPSKLINLANV